MKKYEIAIFDVDGTILDTSEGIISAVKRTIRKKGLFNISNKELLTFIGPPIQDSFARIYNLKGDILQELTTIFRDFYKGEDLFKAIPYDGIYEVMDEMIKRDIKIAIATYKRQDYALTILKYFGFNKYSNILNGADHENKLKKSDIIKKCLDDLNVIDYNNAVMIGDSFHDANGAKLLGIDFIGVTYGFDFKIKEDVYKYPCIGSVNTPQELLIYF